MKPTFTISETFKVSWKCLKEQIWILVGLFIGYTIISGLLQVFMPQATPGDPFAIFTPTSLIVMLIATIFSSVFNLGYIKNMFQALDGIEPQFSAYGQQARKILTYIITNIILVILVFIGIMLLIIPGFYLGLRLQFAFCFIVEEDAGIIDSLKKSWEITNGQVWLLFLLTLVMIGIVIIGFLLLGVGIFIAYPLIILMQCYVFRKLNNPVAVLGEVMEDVIEEA